MKSFLIKTNLIVLMLAILLACADDDSSGIRGSGPTTTRTLNLPAVRGLDVSGAIDVVISQGTSQTVTIEGQDNLIDILSTEVDNGVWNVRFTQNVRDANNFTVFITVADLDILSLSGASSATADGNLALDELTMDISGASDVRLQGTVNRQILEVSGASTANNFDLVSRETEVEASGASDAKVTATERLDATANGASTIRYRGNPATIERETGGASEIVPG